VIGYRSFLFILVGFILAFQCVVMEFVPDVAAAQLNTLLNMEWWNSHNTMIVGIGVGITGIILLVKGARP
jgi:uncharacterized membrane protein